MTPKAERRGEYAYERSRSRPMARIMIRCPVTGRIVFTGMETDRKSFESAVYSRNSVFCPYCAQRHTWDKKDAWLED